MLQAGLDLLDQGIAVFDADAALMVWNAPFIELLGLPPASVRAGVSCAALASGHAALAGCAKDGALPATEQAGPDGRILQVRSQALPQGGFALLVGDITEQRYIENLIQHQGQQLEERVARRTAQLENANANLVRANAENSRIAAALRRSEERLRLINDTIPTLIGYFDHDEVYQYANRRYSEWFGISEAEMTGAKLRSVLGEQVYAQAEEHVRTALSGTQVAYEYSMERRGRTYHARSILVPEIGSDGQALGCFVFSYDITEQKRMQAALVQAQKMEAIGQLTGGLAHDFNNLLTVIIGNLAALQDQRADAEVDAFVAPALQSARRGVQLIRRLLTFSRRQPLDPQPLDVGRLIGEVATLIRRSLPESILISAELPELQLFCLADPGQLESALLNFALNARDAMPEGGRLHLGARPIELADNAADFDVQPGSYILVEVTDNGCGMDAETLGRVFEPFFTTKRFGLGSGLGLSMVYGFVRQSGGGILISSQPGQGSSVLMVLPRCLAGEEGDALADELPPAHGELVLLVEDEPSVRRVVREQLISLGYPVIEAENGAQALELVEYVPDIAIVLSDVVMPGGINGRQLAGRVLERRPGLHVVLMSGYADGCGDGPGGGLPLLAKPFSKQDLARSLRPEEKQR